MTFKTATPTAVKKELAKRKFAIVKPLLLDPSFSKQNDFINDTSRYLSAQCSRRAGKTSGLALRFFKTMEKHPGTQCIYMAMTRDSARDIMWPVLKELDDRFKLGCRFTDTRLVMTHPNGSSLRLLGADMKGFIKRIRGIKAPGVAVDEAQDFGSHLRELIDDIITPVIADYRDGWIAITGTPGAVPTGYFFEVTSQHRYGYSNHEWTILDNPYMPDPAAFIKDMLVKREWDENHPTLLREWRNKWVLDVQSLWVRYKESLNNFTQLPVLLNNAKWYHILGIDIGWKDADALAVLAYSEQSPDVYLVEEVITPKQTITELAGQIEILSKKYNICKMVIDAGGLGKKVAEELRRQKGLPVQDADKMLKQQNVEFLNDALRLGRFKAKPNSRFAQDSYLVQVDWDKSTPDRIVIKKHPHSDIIDAVLYAFKESPAYAFEKAKAPPKPGTKEWADAQDNHMFNAELEGLTKQQEYEDWLDNIGPTD